MQSPLIEIYNYFTSKIYKTEFFDLFVTDNHKKIISNFPDTSKEYVFDFCIFQFNYMLSKSPRLKEHRMPFQTVFSKKGIERYKNKKDGYMHYAYANMETYGINRADILAEKEILRTSTEIIQVEEKEKGRFFNTGNGLSHCILSTSLYNGKSLYCIRCKFSKQCKQVLKKQYFPIYIDRKL